MQYSLFYYFYNFFLKGIDSINPYIPGGVWYDYHTGEQWVTNNGTRKTLKANLTDINIAIRGGYILPAQGPGKTVKER